MENEPFNVYFIGAGASIACGLPGTFDIIKRLHELTKKDNKYAKENYDTINKFTITVFDEECTSSNIPNLPELLTILDLNIKEGQGMGSDYPPEKLSEVRKAFEIACSEALGDDSSRYKSGFDIKIEPLMELARKAGELKTGERLAFISTNYDLLLTRAVFKWNKETEEDLFENISYGSERFYFTAEPFVNRNFHEAKTLLLNIHGCLNTVVCPSCGRMYFHADLNLMRLTYLDKGDLYSEGERKCHCDAPLRPILITPGYLKSYETYHILSTWNYAFNALALAKSITFIGFSLPPDDIFIKNLLLRSKLSRSIETKLKITVVDIDKMKDELFERYSRIYDESIEIECYPNGLSDWLKKI